MADEELHKTNTDGQLEEHDHAEKNAGEEVVEPATATVVVDEAPQADPAQGKDQDVIAESEVISESVEEDPDPEKEKEEEESIGDLSMAKIESVLSSTVDEKDMTPQMRRMMQRQKENTKRVEESIKGTKANPGWFVPVFCILMVIGLVWAVVFYLTGKFPIPGIGQWNLLVAFAFIMAGFIMTMWWR